MTVLCVETKELDFDFLFLFFLASTAWVFNPRPARFYYAARGQVCKLCVCSRAPLIWMLVIGIAKYPDLLGPSGKDFRSAFVLHLFMSSVFPHLSNTYKELCMNVLFVRK
jgi:hypothetical protein